MKKHLFMEVEFHSTLKLPRHKELQIKKWLRLASLVMDQLKDEGIIHKTWMKDRNGLSVSLLLCGDSRIRKLNREHRQKDKVTDVLSFPAHDSLRTKKTFMGPEGDVLFLGDLAICGPQADRQAKQFSIGSMDEFIHLFFHGLFHLIGYDHEISAREERLMQKWEKRALDMFSEIKKGP